MFIEPENRTEKFETGLVIALENNQKIESVHFIDPEHIIITDKELIKRAKSRICLLYDNFEKCGKFLDYMAEELEIANKNGAKLDIRIQYNSPINLLVVDKLHCRVAFNTKGTPFACIHYPSCARAWEIEFDNINSGVFNR